MAGAIPKVWPVSNAVANAQNGMRPDNPKPQGTAGWCSLMNGSLERASARGGRQLWILCCADIIAGPLAVAGERHTASRRGVRWPMWEVPVRLTSDGLKDSIGNSRDNRLSLQAERVGCDQTEQNMLASRLGPASQ